MTFRQLRERAGLTQSRLAKHAGVQAVTVSQLELGKIRHPKYDTVARLAAALDVPTARIAMAIEDTPKFRGPLFRRTRRKSRKKAA